MLHELQGMLRSVVVGQFYKDLKDQDFETAFAIYHRRFSTNTTPKWPLAQPMRFLGHNGECRQLQGGELQGGPKKGGSRTVSALVCKLLLQHLCAMLCERLYQQLVSYGQPWY